MPRTNPLRIFAGSLLATTLLAGPAAAQGLQLGALVPLTGGLQTYGEGSLNGINLAAKQANEAGGVLDGEVNIVVGDTQTKSQPAVDAAKRLVSIEGVSGLVGALSSGNTIPVATSVSAVEGVPQISNASTAPAITDLNDNDFLFRTTPSDAQQGVVLADLVNEAGTERVATLYVNNDYGKGLAESFQTNFEELGGTVTTSAAFEPNKASYRGELQSVSGGDAEALLLIAYPDDGGLLIIRQSLEEGFFQDFIFTDGMKATKVVDDIGAQYLNGDYGTAPRAVESEARSLFVEAYEAEYGELPPLPYIDGAYDATSILVLAAAAAGSDDPEAIRDQLRAVANPPGEVVRAGEFEKAFELIAAGTEINYEGAAGAQDFDENGDVRGTYEHWAFQEGEIATVEIIE